MGKAASLDAAVSIFFTIAHPQIINFKGENPSEEGVDIEGLIGEIRSICMLLQRNRDLQLLHLSFLHNGNCP